MMKTVATAISLIGALVVGACVTVDPTPRRRPASTQPAQPTAPGEKPTLPEGKIADPVPLSATSVASLSAIIYPAGLVSYDGVALPLVSPDGKLIAVEQGTAPSWDTLFAAPGQSPSLATRVAVYDITGSQPKEIKHSESLPKGAILGRSCDAQGFLLECPQPDGSRWIARIAWLTGRTEWLAQGQTVNAHATLSPTGLLAFARSTVAGKPASLVVRGTDGVEIAHSFEDASAAYPLFTQDGKYVFAFLLSDRGLELTGLHLDNPREPKLGSTAVRQLIVKQNEIAIAYQCVASAAPCLPGLGEDPPPAPILIFHPGLMRMAVLDPRDGAFVGLLPQSQAAVVSPFTGNPGYVQTTPEGLMFIPPPPRTGASDSKSDRPTPSARLMDTPYVARTTTNPDRPFILVGPAGKNDPNHFVVLGMGLAPPPKE